QQPRETSTVCPSCSLGVGGVRLPPVHHPVPVAAGRGVDVLADRVRLVEEVVQQPQAGKARFRHLAVVDRVGGKDSLRGEGGEARSPKEFGDGRAVDRGVERGHGVVASRECGNYLPAAENVRAAAAADNGGPFAAGRGRGRCGRMSLSERYSPPPRQPRTQETPMKRLTPVAVLLCLAAAPCCLAGIPTNRFTISLRGEYLAVRGERLVLGQSTLGSVS